MNLYKRLAALFILAVLITSAVMPALAQDNPPFPVTIEHKFGSTTITKAPERVLSLGYSDQDAILALGVVPIGIRYWYGDPENAVFPWAQDKVGDAKPAILSMDFGKLNYEAILALKPDLIIAISSGITQEEYDTLSAIAPTVAQSADFIDFGTPWQEATKTIGKALGKSAEAEELVKHVEDKIVQVREQNPGFEGKSIVVAYNFGDAHSYGFYTAQDGRARFFTNLGFVIPEELVKIAGDKFYSDISNERLDLFDRDLIVFVGLKFAKGGKEGIETDPLISSLKAAQEGRIVYVDEAYDDALQFNSVLSIEYALDGIVPQIQKALGLEPVATATMEASAESTAAR